MESWWHPIAMLIGAIVFSVVISPLFELLGVFGRIVLPSIGVVLTVLLYFI